MFIGRENELAKIRKQLKPDRKAAILIYGKRRIGKTSIIQQACKDFDGIKINHLCAKTSYEGNLALLARSVSMALNLPQLSFGTIFDLFDFLKKQDKHILLVLDEYQYFKESLGENELDSYMQAILDSLPENIKIILCGSYIAMMKELLKEQNPLFGRFTLILNVEEFDYLDASSFYANLSVREKIRYYAVFGGSPFVLSKINYNIPFEANISELMMDQNSILRSHIENVMLKEISRSYDIRIFEALGNGKKKYSEIASIIGMSDTSLLDKQLKHLMNMQALVKTFPINKPNDRKKQFYEIKDNLMRFYFKFVFGKDTLISKFGEMLFAENNVFAYINSFISLRFEAIAMQYFSRIAKKGMLKGVRDFGSYWYDDRKNARNGQFDCVLKTDDGYDFYEAKFYSRPMTLRECIQEEEQIRAIPGINCRNMGFICSAGFEFSSEKYKLITADEMYSDELR